MKKKNDFDEFEDEYDIKYTGWNKWVLEHF
jgi:hypothetical protein